MWDTIAVVFILLMAAWFGVKRLLKMFGSQRGCGGACACKGKPKDTVEIVQLSDLRQNSDI